MKEPREKVVIRDNDYYGGSVWIEHPSQGAYPNDTFRIVWEGYDGGAARIDFRNAHELEVLAKLAQEAADRVDPDRIDRDT